MGTIIGNPPDEDSINPSYYKSASGLESIDVIEAFGLQNNLYLAAAVQYILRAGKKQDRTAYQDIEKAIWYLKRFLKQVPTADTGKELSHES